MLSGIELWAILKFYAPLGAIGLYRWTLWGTRKVVGRWYKPTKPNSYSASIAIVVPVYNEEPDVFRHALQSWAANNVQEIIAVVDHSDVRCIEIFKEFALHDHRGKLIVTEKSGKRPALVDGARAASSDIVAFVDSDTIWSENIVPDLLAPFQDPLVAGVGTRQSVFKADSLARKIFNIQLDTRYNDEFPFLAVCGDAFTCLSGRTALYRRVVAATVLDGLLGETFAGQKCISGDDKCMTRLVQERGWKTKFQSSATVYTAGSASFWSYLKQQIRWARNSWRSDIQSIGSPWIWQREKILGLYMLDRFVEPLFVMLGPVYLIVSLWAGRYLAATILVCWWFLGRLLKVYPSLRAHKQSLGAFLVFVPCIYLMNALKMYAFFSMNTQGWITRWDKNRIGGKGNGLLIQFRKWSPVAAVIAVVACEIIVVAFYAGLL